MYGACTSSSAISFLLGGKRYLSVPHSIAAMKRLLLWLLFLPLQLLLALIFLMVDLAHLVVRLFSSGPETPPPDPLVDPLCTIVVLNWNGRHLLEESLPPLVRAVTAGGRPHQILLVDNGSSDDSVAWVKSRFPRVDRLELPQNLGFGEGNNRGVEDARHPVVVLLNNDMIVAEDFLEPLLQPFADPDVFAVSSQIFLPEGRRREETGNTRGRFRKGYLELSHDPVGEAHHARKVLPVLWGGGGSTAFRRDRFLAMGGFSELFSPCYLEDTDLSYRAWRRGWKVLLAAESRVLHKHRSTTSTRFATEQLSELVENHKLCYLWSNFQWSTLFPHFLLFPVHLGSTTSTGAYLGALKKLPAILWARLSEPKRARSDREILGWTGRPLTYLNQEFPHRRPPRQTGDKRLKILVVSAYLPHLGTHGGAGRVFQFLRRTAEKHEVTLLTFLEGPHEEPFLDQVQQCCHRVETVLRREFESLSLFPYEPFEEFHTKAFRERMEEVLSREDFDRIHFEWPQMALYRDLAPQVPTLLTEVEVNYAAHHSLIAVESHPLKKIRLLYNTLQTLYREVELCKKVDRVICVTGDDRDYLKGYLPAEKLEVVNTGVDSHYFQFQPDPAEPGALVFVGAFRHSPNVDAMLYFCKRVFPSLLGLHPQAHLYIVGSSPPPEIRALGRHPQITVTGFVEDIRRFYEKAQVVVVPLRTGVGIRGKILEGWAVGRATVATPLACRGIRAFHGENIMIAEDAETFALWTSALLRNADFCRQLGWAARKTVEEHYDWNVVARRMLEIYEDGGW